MIANDSLVYQVRLCIDTGTLAPVPFFNKMLRYMDTSFKIIRNYPSQVQLTVAKKLLTDAQIPHMTSSDSVYMMVGDQNFGHRILVAEADMERAHEILSEMEEK